MNPEELLRRRSKQIGELLRSYCEARMLSQRDMAAIIGKEVSYVNKILRGEANLALRTIVEIECSLGISIFEPTQRISPLVAPADKETAIEQDLYSYALAS